MAFEPQQFGKYTLYEKLAVGGMALIYRARIQGVKGFQKDLVIKQILPQYSGMNDFIDMFIDEAKIAVNLNHANIVPVYELGEIDGQLYIAMEYVAGKDLASMLEACEEKKVVLPPRLAAYVMIGVCRGLDYAHNKKDDATRQPLNIIHRDISPNNVIVSHEGEVKIIDFGIAKASIKVSVTQFGTLKGKMIYMSPEQAAEGKLDARSDVFSAGILLYEMVTGKKPYGGDNFAVTQENVKNAAFPPPEQVHPGLPPMIGSIIQKAMARNPDERFASAFDFERALSDYLFSTGANVYARDVAKFMDELFGDGPVSTGDPLPAAKVPTITNIRNLRTDGGSPAPAAAPAETPTNRPVPVDTGVAPTAAPDDQISLGPPMSSFTPTADAPAVRLDGNVPAAPVPEEPPPMTASIALSDLPDEGPAIEEENSFTTRTGAPSAPDTAPTPVPSTAESLLGDDADAFEIPPPPADERSLSQRDTVVTRLPASRPPATVPAPPADGPTPPPMTARGNAPATPVGMAMPAPVAGREGVVPGVSRADATRTSTSAGRSPDASWLDVGATPDPTGSVVPSSERDEETAPGASSSSSATVRPAATPRPVPSRGTVTGAARPSSTMRAPGPPPATAVGAGPPRAPAPANVRQAETPPGMTSPARGTPAPPWDQSGGSSSVGGLINRVMGRSKPAAPPGAAEITVLEGSYDSPHDFLTNSYATYGDRRGLFLSTNQLDTKLGVDIPLDVQFRAPQAGFRVHGRVIWRRAKDGLSKGKRLPAGLAIEFVEGLDDDLEALFAYLGLP